MPRVHLNQTNFTAGELSPDMYGRTDIDRYPNGAAIVENAICLIQGGVRGRDGTQFVAEGKTATDRIRLIPFVFNRNQSYVLEFGHLYMRVFKNEAGQPGQVLSGGMPYEIATPYSVSMLDDMAFDQTADTMFIVHPLVMPQRLRRFAHAYWDIGPAPFSIEPFDELGTKPAATLSLSSTTPGSGVTATASASAFMASDVGRNILSQAGSGEITAVGSATSATITTVVAFESASIASGSWTIDGTPQATCTPADATPVGKVTTLTLDSDGWRAEDVGKIVKINGGLCQITAVTSATVVDAKILKVLTSDTGAEALSWTLNASVWHAGSYPSAIAFNEQRLTLGGSPTYPRTVWGSVIGDVLDFLLGDEDSDAFAFALAAADEVRHLASVRELISLAYSGEFVLEGGVEKPITPTNVQVRNQSVYGASGVRPVRIGNELYFVQRSGKKLRGFAYQYAQDTFDAPDITKLANHITGPGVTEMAYQQEPDSRLMCVRRDGLIANMTIDRGESVVAWSRFVTDGLYESIACIPNGDTDQTWVVVIREVNGETRRYIEVFTPGIATDAAITGHNGSGSATWSGLDHLEGKLVSIVADGVVMPQLTVSGGQVLLPRPAKDVQIGLPYVCRVYLLPIEFPTGSGTAQGAQTRNGEIIVRLKDTVGLTINDEDIPFRRFGTAVLDHDVKPFSGEKRVTRMGWTQGRGAEVILEQRQPLPWHVLSVVRRVTVND